MYGFKYKHEDIIFSAAIVKYCMSICAVLLYDVVLFMRLLLIEFKMSFALLCVLFTYSVEPYKLVHLELLRLLYLCGS